MIANALRQFGHLWQIASLGPVYPFLEIFLGLGRLQLPDALDGQLELISLGGLAVQVLDVDELQLLLIRQVVRVLQPQELRLLEGPVLPGLFDPDAVDGVVQQLDDMEMVEDHYRNRECLQAASDESR